jgi:hypothetical protein
LQSWTAADVAPANSAGFDAATATPGLRMDVKRRPNKNTKPLFQTKLKLFLIFFFGPFQIFALTFF